MNWVVGYVLHIYKVFRSHDVCILNGGIMSVTIRVYIKRRYPLPAYGESLVRRTLQHLEKRKFIFSVGPRLGHIVCYGPLSTEEAQYTVEFIKLAFPDDEVDVMWLMDSST